MSDLNLLAVSPYIVLSATAVVVMLTSTLVRSHRTYMALTGAGLAGTFACVLLAAGSADRRATILLRVDDYALYFTGLVVAITGAVVLLSYGYLQRTERQRGDYYVLVLLAALGAAILVASSHFASLFLGLEILSVSLYGLIAYPRGRSGSTEAGLKYLVLAASTAAFLLMGMALVYAVSGVMSLDGLAVFADSASGWDKLLYQVGLALVLVGIGFKLALVPFHLWTPDVYQGAPAPVTAFVATVSKGAVFALLLRYAGAIDLAGGILVPILVAVAYASMLVGNLLALLQQNLKRLLAYSSIAHLGYLLVALVAGGASAGKAVAFYLAVYSVALVAAFGVVTVLSDSEGEPESIEAYGGVGRNRPVLAAIFTVALLSLAGIPVTAGFMGKFFVVQAGAGAALWGLLVVLALTSAMSLYYYLRVVIVMFGKVPAESRDAELGRLYPARSDMNARVAEARSGNGWYLAAVTLVLLALITVFLGVYPEPLVRLIEQAAVALR